MSALIISSIQLYVLARSYVRSYRSTLSIAAALSLAALALCSSAAAVDALLVMIVGVCLIANKGRC